MLALLALHWVIQTTHTDASLRGLRVVSRQVVWASGTKGTVLKTTDGGEHWSVRLVPGAEELDFRDLEAFDETTAYVLASGDGLRSRVYKTVDGGRNWRLLFTNPDATGFFDALAFTDARHGMLLGDPVNGQFSLFTTADGGESWQRRSGPAALPEEGAFAGSGTCLVVRGRTQAWFATGGPGGARVFRSNDGGESWVAAPAPLGGVKSAGVFSLGFWSAREGVAVGGDYKEPKSVERSAATTHDSGKTWQPAKGVSGYRSGAFVFGRKKVIAVGTDGSDVSADRGKTWRRMGAENLNAVAGAGGAVFGAGPKGMIVKLATFKE